MPMRLAPPCDQCGAPYLHGTRSTCDRCLRLQRRKRRAPLAHSPRQPRLNCDCGNKALVVVLVQVGITEEEFTEERLALCQDCLQQEEATVDLLEELGLGGEAG
jgi:hypothetical protein